MGALDGSDPLRGVLGAVLGESKAEQQERLREVTSQANDLSGLVKKRKAKVDVAEDGFFLDTIPTGIPIARAITIARRPAIGRRRVRRTLRDLLAVVVDSSTSALASLL